MKAVIMAGGKGTRLSTVSCDIPKPMVLVGEKPVLERQIICLEQNHIRDIILIVGHLGDKIKQYFKDGSDWNVNITYVEEEGPLGTAGALFRLKGKLDNSFLLVFGDIMLDVDFTKFITFHKSKSSKATLFAHPNSHPFDSDLVYIDQNERIIGWDSKHNTRDYDYKNLVNAGVYILTDEIFRYIVKEEKRDLEKDVIIPMINDGMPVYAYRSSEYTKDMGTPDRLESVNQDYYRGICDARNLRNKQKCIFLDRDGTINEHVGFLNKVDQMKLLERTADAISKINKSEYICCIITNQPVVARGECTLEDLEKIHNRMETLLGYQGAYVDRIYFCPHHPHSGYEGEIKELKLDCDCRKPKIGMITQAVQELNIDLAQSYYIGDTTIDIQTARNAGIKSVLVQTGEAGLDNKYMVLPDETYVDLYTAVEVILNKEENTYDRL